MVLCRSEGRLPRTLPAIPRLARSISQGVESGARRIVRSRVVATTASTAEGRRLSGHSTLSGHFEVGVSSGALKGMQAQASLYAQRVANLKMAHKAWTLLTTWVVDG